MNAEQFAFVVGLACGFLVGALVAGRVMAVSFARIVAETPALRAAWLGKPVQGEVIVTLLDTRDEKNIAIARRANRSVDNRTPFEYRGVNWTVTAIRETDTGALVIEGTKPKVWS